MKYSYMSFSTPQASLRDMVDMACRYGYHGIEPRIDANHRHGIETSLSRKGREEARATAVGAGIAFSCIATSLNFADPTEERETFEGSLRAIDLAADLGCGCIRVFGGTYPENMSRIDAVEQCVEGFRQVVPHAAERKVKLAFETHDAWTDPKDVMLIIGDVDDAALQVNWDVMHPVRSSGYSMAEAYEILAPAICHVHVHDGSGPGEDLRVLPMGTGAYDHRTAIGLLKKAGYKGYISGEWITSIMPEDYGYEKHLPRELAALRSYEAESS